MADKQDAPVTAKPDFHLVVMHAFGNYQRGDKIEDAAEVSAVLDGENSRSVRKVFAQ